MSASAAVILDSPQKWKSWLYVISNIARFEEVWDHIDPNTNAPTPIPRRPRAPTAGDAAQGQDDLNALMAGEKDLYKLLYQDYIRKDNKIDKINEDIKRIGIKIMATVQSLSQQCMKFSSL